MNARGGIHAAGVAEQISRLRDVLSPLQISRLTALTQLIDEDCRLNFGAALNVLFPQLPREKAQASFRKFRLDLQSAVTDAGIVLRLEVDSAKKSPADQRWCWFDGDDPSIAQLEKMSKEETRDHYEGDLAVAGRAARVLSPRVLKVRIEVSPTESKAPTFYEFEKSLRTHLELLTGNIFVVTSSETKPPAGEKRAEFRLRLKSEADILVRLVSTDLLSVGLESDAASRAPVIDVLYASLPVTIDLSDHGVDQLSLVTGLGKAYLARRGPDKAAFMAEIAARIATFVRSNQASSAMLDEQSDAAITLLNDYGLGYDPAVDETVGGARAAMFDLNSSAIAPRASRTLSDPFDVVQRIVDWSIGLPSEDPDHCVVLGDYGTGKTTTARALTQALLLRRKSDPKVPLPLYFDLRTLSAQKARECNRLSDVLDGLLAQMENVESLPNGNQLVQLLQSRKTVVIFDGLDEVLVHLDLWEGQKFTRILWRAIATGRGKERVSKLLITCRTHFFRSIREESEHFTGQDRFGPGGQDYLALVLLPFTEEQIRSYLTVNVPESDANSLMELMSGVHNLGELASRPYTLRLISSQLEYIERTRAAGAVVRATDIYANIVDSWLGRDNGKHTLLRQHKKLLMQRLAADLWLSGYSVWDADHLEQWLVEFLQGQPSIRVHYPDLEKSFEVVKEDLRTATFVSRGNDDTFRFAHTSLHEYFLAGYLVRALTESDSIQDLMAAWTMLTPSQETLSFLGQTLQGLSSHDLQRAIGSLESLKTDATGLAATLSFRYGILADSQGLPHHVISGSRLDGLALEGLSIAGRPSARVDLRSASFRGARMRDCLIEHVDLRGADLTEADLSGAVLVDSLLDDAVLHGTNLQGAAFHQCTLLGVDVSLARARRTQVFGDTGAVGLSIDNGWLPDRLPGDDPTSLGPTVAYRSHTGAIVSAALNPEGERVVTASQDGTARVWDGRTGENLATLAGGDGPISEALWSADGRYIITIPDGGPIRIWADSTFDETLCIPVAERVLAVEVAGPLLAFADERKVEVWNLSTGRLQVNLSSRPGRVRGLGFSSDGTRLVTASSDLPSAVWSTVTGEREVELLGQYQLASAHFDGAGNVLGRELSGTTHLWVHPLTARAERVVTNSDIAELSQVGSQVFLTTRTSEATIWEPGSSERPLRLNSHTGTISDARFTMDGSKVLTTSIDTTARLWDSATGSELWSYRHGEPLKRGLFNREEGHVVVISDTSIAILDAATGNRIVKIQKEEQILRGMHVCTNGSRIVTTDTKGHVAMWNAATGALVSVISPSLERGGVANVSEDGSLILVVDPAGKVQAWEAESGTLSHEASGDLEEISIESTAVQIRGSQATLVDARTGASRRVLSSQNAILSSAEFSPDRSLLATTGSEGQTEIWSATTGDLIRTIRGHRGNVNSVRFSSDGLMVVTAGDDGLVRVSSSTTAMPLAALRLSTEVQLATFDNSPRPGIFVASNDNVIRHFKGDRWTLDGMAEMAGTETADLEIHLLPGGESASLRPSDNVVVGSSPLAWKWLGRSRNLDGRRWRMPAAFAELPSKGS